MRWFLPLVLVVVVGCSVGPRASGPSAVSFPEGYQRVVTPDFPVVDSTGQSFRHPFTGGLNVPRPQFSDVDSDGDADLFVQENAGQVAFYENVPAGDSSRLAWRSDAFQDLAVGEWFRFADLDGDGDPDLMAEQPFSHIRVYRNTGTADGGVPRFEPFVDTLRTASGEAIFSDRQNIPNVSDIDCDGKLDLFLGRLDGTITRYEAEGDSAGMPVFEHVTDRFEGIEIINQQMASARHGANTLAFEDVDSDGDVDLFWGDFFEPGLLLIENRGSACERPNLRGDPQPFPPSDPLRTSGYNAPTLADYDRDGDTDLFVGVLGGAFDPNTTLATNFHFYERTPEGFVHRTAQFLSALDAGSESTTAWGDLDGDGDLDGLFANKIEPGSGTTSRVYRLENTGSPGAPAYRLGAPLDLPNAYHYAPALGDLDGDGDLDALLGTWQGRIAYAENEGDGTFGAVQTDFAELPRGSNTMPTLGDLDGDGDLDLIVGESSGGLNFFRNEGTPTDPSFVLVSEDYTGVSVDDRSAPALHDVDGDGDLDVVLGEQAGRLQLIRNTGTPQAPAWGEPEDLPLDAPRLASPAPADVDGDGTVDWVLGGESGGLVLYLAP